MTRWWIVLALGGALAAVGCEQREGAEGEQDRLEGVEDEMAELGQAREEAPEEAERLRQELAEAEQRAWRHDGDTVRQEYPELVEKSSATRDGT